MEHNARIGPGIVDTTLRDGEQAAGIAFSGAEKLQIARLLDQMGVPILEVGTPAMGILEQEAICSIRQAGLNCQLVSWNRILEADIKASLACEVKLVHLSAPVSDIMIYSKLRHDRSWVIDQLRRSVYFAVSQGCTVSVGAEDASRADTGFLQEFAAAAREEGAVRLRYADTVGILDPFAVRERLTRLVTGVEIPVEFHGHNDFGLATANTLAAWLTGASWVSVTVNGIGERAGNAALEEVVMGLSDLYRVDMNLDPAGINEVCRFVAKASNRPFNLPYKTRPRQMKRFGPAN